MAKVINLKKDENIKQLKEKFFDAQQKNHGLDAKKHFDVINIQEAPVEYQKRIRNEWNS